MTAALKRLLDEAIPDGTFGGVRTPGAPRPAPVSFPAPRREVTPEEAAAHYAALVAALDEIEHRGTGDAEPDHRPERHLHAVPQTPRSAA